MAPPERTSDNSSLLIYQPRKDEKLSWPVADLQRTVYPHKWSPVNYRSSAGQGKFAGQRPTFYHCATHSLLPVHLIRNSTSVSAEHRELWLLVQPFFCKFLYAQEEPATQKRWQAWSWSTHLHTSLSCPAFRPSFCFRLGYCCLKLSFSLSVAIHHRGTYIHLLTNHT